MKKLLVILLSLIFATSLSAAVSASFVIPLTSSIYDEADALYMMEGLSRPSSSRPWSVGELDHILSRLDEEGMDEGERRLLSSVLSEREDLMRWNDGNDFSFSSFLDVSLEGYAHTNNSDIDRPEEWLRGFEERRPLLRLRLDGSVGDIFYTYCDLQYGMGKITPADIFVSLEPGKSPFVTSDGYIASYKMSSSSHMLLSSHQYSSLFAANIPKATAYFDFVWPKRAMVSISGEKWNLQFGRDRIETGISRAGSLILDNHSDWNDHFTLSFYSRNFKYTWRNVFLNGIMERGQKPVNESRIFMIHTLEFRILNSLSMMISEDLMYRLSGEQAIDFSFLNPAYIYHNLNNRGIFNAIAYAEVKWAPIKGMEVYGQFALDQATAPNERDDQDPSWGMSLGASYCNTYGKGFYTLFAEGLYTTPLMYRRDMVDFIKCIRYFHLKDNATNSFGSNALSFEYLGFKYGSDSIFLTLGGDYSIPGDMKASLSLSFLTKGDVNIFYSHNDSGLNDGLPNIGGTTPTGSPDRFLMASTVFEKNMASLFSYPAMDVGVEADWIGVWKGSGRFYSDFQFSLYSTVTF